MLNRRLPLILLLGLLACGEDSDSGPAPFVVPEQFDVSTEQAEMSVDDMAIGDQDADISDAAIVDQMLIDAMILPQCSDGEDNDGDGQTDYPQDDGCEASDDDDEEDVPFQACEDGLDNDEDGLIDFEDPGCAGGDDPSEISLCGEDLNFEDISDRVTATAVTEGLSRLSTCRNNLSPEKVYLFTLRESVVALGFDTAGSDYDTLLGVYRSCPNSSEPEFCSDDVSNSDKTSRLLLESPALGDYYVVVDGHGRDTGQMVLNITRYDGDGDACVTDEVGRSCLMGRQCVDGICVPSLCSNGVDDDSDQRIDYPLDPGCESADDNTEDDPLTPTQCSDGLDNDFDGQVDYPSDPNCEDAADNEERSPPVCSDGIDNDNDGLIDLEDPGCRDNPTWFTETNAPACNNFLDDDGDGFIDFPTDPGCLYPDDNDEVDPDLPSECNDGLDNDMDGLIDYPLDTDSCFYASDNQEDDPCLRVEPIDASGQSRLRGTLSLGNNDFAGSCGGSGGSDVVFKYVVPENRPLSELKVSGINSDFSSIVYVRNTCAADTEQICRSNSQISLGPQQPGTELWIFLDSAQNDTRAYRLDITATVEAGGNCAGEHYGCPSGLTCQRSAGAYRCVLSECADGEDNDEDGLVDYPNDPGCTEAADTDETDPLAPPVCSNGFDDDGDGLIDYGEDPECSSAADRDERPECSDGVDNDGDGRTDFDRDADGIADSTRDFSCVCANDPSEGVNPMCGDGCDNDNDGLIDLEDPGCTDRTDSSEDNVPQCSDGLDNNNDGLVDYPADPGCPNPSVNLEETPTSTPACADGVDNDMDGTTDFGAMLGDDGCHAAADTDENPYCEEDIPSLPLSGTVSGNTRGQPAQSISSCTSGNSASELRYRVDVPYPAKVTARIYDTDFSPNLYARSTCDGQRICPPDSTDCTPGSTELACRIFGRGSAGLLTLPQHEGDLFLFVDGRTTQVGNFKLDVEVLFPRDGRCMLDDRDYVKCEDDRVCSFNLQRGYATCN